MRLVKWRPAAGIPSIHHDMEDLFDNFFPWNRGDVERGVMEWAPRVNVKEYKEKFELSAEIPGMEKDQINVEVQDGVLTIRGEKNSERETTTEEKYHIFERSYGKFARSFTLPDNTDQDKLEADYVNGVLKITIPKTEKAKPKEIKVNVK